MNMSRRTTTTSRPVITRSLWEEIRTQFLHNIATIVVAENIPDELILNLDQTPSKYVAASKITMHEKGAKHVTTAGGNDKRTVTLTVVATLSGCLLPFQIIYAGKTDRCLPPAARKDGDFLCSYNKSHWSNQEETLRIIDGVLVPYIEKVKQELKLPASQKALLIWDAFTGQGTKPIIERLDEVKIAEEKVPKNLTHLLQPLDLTTNGAIKKIERRERIQ